METKEFKVNIPEGYEIDTENSTFECIKFKPTTNPTYEDIARSLFKDGLAYCTNGHGVIIDAAVNTGSSVSDSNNATNQIQLARLLAMNQLLNIAEYYNQKREETPSGYIIFRANDGHLHATRFNKNTLNTQVPFFYSREDAESVINNPNFKRLLDSVYL